jgi:hypothetical protein
VRQTLEALVEVRLAHSTPSLLCSSCKELYAVGFVLLVAQRRRACCHRCCRQMLQFCRCQLLGCGLATLLRGYADSHPSAAQLGRAVVALEQPDLEVYGKCCFCLSAAVIHTSLMEAGHMQRPKGRAGFQKPPQGSQSIGQLHAELCQVGKTSLLLCPKSTCAAHQKASSAAC